MKNAIEKSLWQKNCITQGFQISGSLSKSDFAYKSVWFFTLQDTNYETQCIIKSTISVLNIICMTLRNGLPASVSVRHLPRTQLPPRLSLPVRRRSQWSPEGPPRTRSGGTHAWSIHALDKDQMNPTRINSLMLTPVDGVLRPVEARLLVGINRSPAGQPTSHTNAKSAAEAVFSLYNSSSLYLQQHSADRRGRVNKTMHRKPKHKVRRLLSFMTKGKGNKFIDVFFLNFADCTNNH